ncbi:inositol monophosphatase [Draconibacterium sp.]|nr:inositol monophosphatase [Draconibacterium sp.]
MKQTLRIALKEAGNILMDNFGKISDYKVKESQSSIVTKADLDSEKKIMEIISKVFPDHNLLGEETGFKNRNSEYTWVVDPIDGTSNFAAGIPWFGIIICVLKNFEPVMAGCYLPVQDQTYFAEKGKGASLNGTSISVSKETQLKNILAVYSLDYSDDPGKTEREAQNIIHLVKNVRNLRSTNCLIDLCYTADGKFGAIINQSTKIWDLAGTGLIIEEAGGKITDLNGNRFDFTLTENNYDRNFEIVGSNKLLHQELLNLFQI